MKKKYSYPQKNHIYKQTGFTLIELLVSITIIVILSVIGMVTFGKTSLKARNAKRQSDLQTVRQALVLYKADEGDYPDETNFQTVVSLLKGGGYLSQDEFVDPKGDPFIYQYSTTGGVDFTLTARLEPATPLEEYTVTNP